MLFFFFFFQAEDGIRDVAVTGVQTCALPILVAGLRTKRDLLVRGLNAIDGISCASPAGAFFCFPDINGVLERTGPYSKTISGALYAGRHITLFPGTSIRPGGAENHRLVYANTPELH